MDWMDFSSFCISDIIFSVPAETVWAVEGKDVELPCDVTPEEDDVLNMVLWFRGASGIPLYRSVRKNTSAMLKPHPRSHFPSNSASS